PPLVLSCPSHARPPARPSFPTRRSSDLPEAHPATSRPVGRFLSTSGRPALDSSPDPRAQSVRRDGPRADSGMRTNVPFSRQDGRSEEHTSELQSRENLVCRLLLEKKKKQ